MSSTVSLLIIGSGPAGYTAAIYAARAGLQPLLFEGQQPGGQLTTTSEVENYPGYPKGVLGPQMMADFKQQAERFGTDIKAQHVIGVDFSQRPYRVWTEDAQYAARTVIIATGASAKWLGLPSETKLNGKGVSACAVCDGYFFKGQTVGVVGGGDTAAEEALYLANLCHRVHVWVRSDSMRASQIMQDRLSKKDNVQIHWCTEIEEILGEECVTGVRMVDKRTQERSELAVEGVFIAIGHHPNTSLFASYLNLDTQGYIQTHPGTTRTHLPGVFAAGDVQDKVYRQAITAAGTGCAAALEAERFLIAQSL